MNRPCVPTDVLNEIGHKLFQIKATLECAKNNLIEVCSGIDEPPEPQAVYLCLCLLLPQFDALIELMALRESEALQSRRSKENGELA